jgi:ATP-dependent DNA helicase RecQ
MIEYYFENGTIPNEDEAKHIPKCGICDNCLGTKTLNMVDIKLEATFIVNYIKDFYARYNYTHGLDKLSSAIRKECGIINIKSKKKCIEIIEFLITKDILKRTSIGTGKYVINIGNNKIKSDQPLMAHMTPEIKTISVNTDKLSKFKEVRDILASKYNITPVVLINDRVLFNIQYKNPKNMSDLWKVDGISNDFIMRYGSEFLELLNKTASIKTNSKTNSKTNNVISDTVKETYKYYKQGKTIDEISKIRLIGNQTIESHILCVWENDENIEIDMEYANLTDDLREKIMKVVETVGEDKLRPIKDGLDGKVTYFQIRLSLLLKKLDL